MTKTELAKALNIDENKVKYKKSKFIITDTEIEKGIDEKIWLEDIEIEFWRCSFKDAITFPQRKNEAGKELIIKTEMFFHDCSFKNFFNARNCIFEKDFKCIACDFEGKIDFSRAEFQGKVDFSVARFENEARFIKTKFSANIANSESAENNFSEAQFERNASFDSAIFMGRVDFSVARFENEARFIKTKFSANIANSESAENDFGEAQFKGKVDFCHTEFQGKVDFSIARFKNEARFIKTKFSANIANNKNTENNFNEAQFEAVLFREIDLKGRVSFEKCIFKKSIFRNIIFPQEEITFWESEFERVNLIDCIFPYHTNFDRCIFKNTFFQNQNIAESMFQHAKFQDCIFKETNTFGEKVFSTELKPILTTNTFEGQFNIDHQYLHYEPEEIPRENISIWRDLFRRLKSNRLAYHNLIDASELHTQELYARELELEQKWQGIRDRIEKWQLKFYRLTSDHHTDLAKIFNNVIMLIALFGIFASILLPFAPSPEPSTMRFIQEGGGELSIFDLKTLYPQSSGYKMGRWAQWLCSFIACVGFVGIYFGFIAMTNWFRSVQKKWAKVCLYVFYTLVYLSSLAFLFYKPPLLLPIIGKFFDESLKLNFAPLQSLCIVYYILMFLMLFSLQKTARKNSIIPS